MNKFLEKYPQLCVPVVGDLVVVIKVYNDKSAYVPYYKIGAICKIVDIIIDRNGILIYEGDFRKYEKIPYGYQGICTLGDYGIHFVLKNEK